MKILLNKRLQNMKVTPNLYNKKKTLQLKPK